MNKFKDSYLYDIVILLAIYGLYFLIFLGFRHLSIPDEGRYPEIAREMLASGNWVTPTINGVPFLDKPPLYYWFEATSMNFFGVNAWAIRLPQAIFGILGCISIYSFGRYFYTRFAGILASFILAANVLYFFESHYANMDLMVANLLWIAFFLCLVSLKQDSNTLAKRLFMYSAYFVSALAFLTKGLMAIAFPCMTIFVWMLLTNNWHRLKELYIPTGVIIFILIISPWLILAQQQNPDFLYYFFYFQQVHRFLGTSFHAHFGFYFFFAITLAMFLPFSILLLSRLPNGLRNIWKNRKQDYITLLISLWYILILLFFSIPTSKLISYVLPIFAPLSLLMACSFEKLILNSDNKKVFIIMHAIASALFLIVGICVLVFSVIQSNFIEDPVPAIFTTSVAVCAFLIAFSIIFSVKNKITQAIAVIIFALMSLNILSHFVIPYFDIKTSKPLVDKILRNSSPDTIYVYYNRPQPKNFIMEQEIKQKGYETDLPILLSNNIYVVYNWKTYKPEIDNWAREFYYGIKQYQQSHDGKWPEYLITYSKFDKLINSSSKNIVIFSTEKQLKKLQKHYPNFIFEVKGKYNNNVVLSVSR